MIETLSQLWKGRAVEDALPGEEGGVVKLDCQKCGKQWLKPAGAENSAGKGCVWLHVQITSGVTTVNSRI